MSSPRKRKRSKTLHAPPATAQPRVPTRASSRARRQQLHNPQSPHVRQIGASLANMEMEDVVETLPAPAGGMEGDDDAQSVDAEEATESDGKTVNKVATVSKIEKFPQLVPMENVYMREEYYVRDCYLEYYELVMKLLKSLRGVTVTGTPGIGNSVFMGYFFERYSREHPNTMIIMASYERDSTLTGVVIAKGGDVIEREDNERAAMEALMAHYARAAGNARGGKLIRLLDGPPASVPTNFKWVSFTSPNEKWLKKIVKKVDECTKVVMPVWTLEELHDAAKRLPRMDQLAEPVDDSQLKVLGADPTDLEKRPTVLDFRFAVFGGVPRMCFIARPTAFENAVSSLQGDIKLMTMDAIIHCIESSEYPVSVHRALHYLPDKDNCERFTIEVGSMAIERYLIKREQDLLGRKKHTMEQIARYIPEMRTMQGFSTEARAQRMLMEGCTLGAKKLVETFPDLDLTLPPSATEEEKITNSFSVTTFDRTQHQLLLPLCKNLPSIDGLYWVPPSKDGAPARVLLIQVTVALKHPVKALGLHKVLKRLDHWETVKKFPHNAAALVFVVPPWNVKSFTLQLISQCPPLTPKSSVRCITGVGAKTEATLNGMGVNSVAQLQSCSLIGLNKEEHDAVKLAQKLAKEHESVSEKDQQILEQIPQYAWGV